jgi:ferredoxin
MCQFCHQHGDGKKWYLNAKNYAEDFLSDLRRRRFISEMFSHPEKLSDAMAQLPRLDRAPGFVQRMVKWSALRRSKREHFGQVVPLEEIATIFGFVNSIVRVPCICRHIKLGREVGYCYGVSMGPQGLGAALEGLDSPFLAGPDMQGLERLTPEQALEAFADHEKNGLCHTVWTFYTPFIGGVCNCDRSDCLAMQATVGHDVKVMFRGEYVAQVEPELCRGCRACMRACQFGALGYSAADEKAVVDARACYGCGICRAACSHEAISLRAREEVPAAAGLW